MPLPAFFWAALVERIPQSTKGSHLSEERCEHNLAPQVGLEPTTLRLTAECSAIELLRNIGMRRRSTLPGRYQPSTIDVLRLNFCVRNGNRWNPQAIATAKGEQDWNICVTGHCLRSVSWSQRSLSVALLCETSQPQFALGFAQAPTGCSLASVAAKGEQDISWDMRRRTP